MKINLSTSLHLDHGRMPVALQPAVPLPMQSFVPLGLLSLKASSDATGIGADINVFELNTMIEQGKIPNDDAFYSHIVKSLTHNDPDMIGFMTDADSLHHTVLLAQAVKAVAPDTLICAGGPAVSPLRGTFLDRFDAFDYLIRGEGEETFSELIETLSSDLSPANILGLTWRQGDNIRENPERRPIENLDDLPIPAFDAYEDIANAPLYLDVGRGCPFSCDFCATAPFWNRRFRMKSPNRVLREIRLLRERFGRNHVNFSHDIFTCDHKWVYAFCACLRDESLGMTWTCSTRTDVINDDLLSLMADAGCEEIYYGIETGSPTMQRRMGKKLDLKRSLDIVRMTADLGIRPVTGFIIGHPEETPESFSDTISAYFEFLKAGKHRSHIFTLCPFQEAPIYAKYKHAMNRRAEYFDLPLTETPTAAAEALLKTHPDIFSSAYRYDTPHVDEGLVDASEEISPKLAAFPKLWGRLLPHYSAAMDFYRRWMEWIATQNSRAHHNSRFKHQGTLNEMLHFLNSEVERLKIQDSVVADLIRYEQKKIEAESSLRDPIHIPEPSVSIDESSTVMRHCDYMAVPFQRKMSDVLSDPEATGENETTTCWVVFAKTRDKSLDILEVGEKGVRILGLVGKPWGVRSLITEIRSSTQDNEDASHPCDLNIIRDLISNRLLMEISGP